MSRIGKQSIIVPKNVTFSQSAEVVTVKGPHGELTRAFPGPITITLDAGIVTCTPKNETKSTERALWGTYASHIKNMIAGVHTPYVKKLILEGVGFKSEVKGTDLTLALGFSHPVIVPIPVGLTVTAEKNNITVTGIDKEAVGSFSAKVRALKKPEPYKGKGFRYDGEVIRRKQGKKS
jgi:large subunit ribosomal protein L6